jgi:tetratricopeptide (TPR) repeat protein
MGLARQLNDKDLLLYCYQRGNAMIQVPDFTDMRKQMTEEYLTIPKIGSRWPIMQVSTSRMIGAAFLMLADRKHAEEIWEEMQEQCKRIGDPNMKIISLEIDSVRAVLDGHLQEAIDISNQMRIIAEEAGILGVAIINVRSGGFRAYLYTGISPEELERWHPDFWNPEEVLAGARQSLILAHWDQNEKASQILEKEVVKRPYFGTDEDSTMTWMDTFFLEASIVSGHKKVAELLYNRLNIPGLYTNGTDVPTSIPRQLGNAAVLLGKPDDAREHYKTSFRICAEMNFRPELALTHLNFAELLLDHYPKEKAEALEHLDFAIKEFREMKMQPSLEKALRRKDILKA